MANRTSQLAIIQIERNHLRSAFLASRFFLFTRNTSAVFFALGSFLPNTQIITFRTPIQTIDYLIRKKAGAN